MASLNFGSSVSLKQAAKLIGTVKGNRFMLRSEPGIGKSSLMGTLAEMYPDYHLAYIDVPNMDLGDICMPVIDHETKTTKYYPNARFGIHTGKPSIIMLDEFSKGSPPVVNMLHPLLEAHNPRLGDLPLHPDSVVFLTGNLTTDGVGDNLKAHTLNRITPLVVRKPRFAEWAEWAIANGIDPIVIAAARQFEGDWFASYLDYTADTVPKDFVAFNPRMPTQSYVSGRSLERASNIIIHRESFDSDSLIAALSGTIGAKAALDLSAYIAFADQLPTWESIIKSPKTAVVPEGAGACALIAFNAIAKVDKETMTPFMEYIERFHVEFQSCFCINMAKSPRQKIAFGCKAFSDWVAKNEDLL
jgi:hypothetical protein